MLLIGERGCWYEQMGFAAVQDNIYSNRKEVFMEIGTMMVDAVRRCDII